MILKADRLTFKNIIRYPKIEIAQNDKVFIKGASGSGKSTLLKLFNATICPTSGTLLYKGQDIGKMEADEIIKLRREVLLVSQAPFLFKGTIYENFKYFYEYREQKPPSQEQVEFFLSICLANFPINKDCSILSGGEKQRVYNSIFLSFQPQVFMLDEPTSALDSENSNKMIKNILEFCDNAKMTLIIISHNDEITAKYATKIISL